MEYDQNFSAVTPEAIQIDDERRSALGLTARLIAAKEYRGMYSMDFAAYEHARVCEEWAAVPLNTKDQLILSLETNE